MVTRYVNTASTAGGNGTTNDIVGANRAFASIQSAESSIRGSNFNDDLEILCCGSTEDTITRVGFIWNTYVTVSHTVHIKANRDDPTGYHGGTWNSGTYRIRTTDTSNPGVLFSDGWAARYFNIDGIQFEQSGSGRPCLQLDGAPTNFLMKDSLLKITSGVSAHGVVINGHTSLTGGGSFQNCVVEALTSNDSNGFNIVTGNGFWKIYNSLIQGFGGAVGGFNIKASGACDVTIKNTVSFNSRDDFVLDTTGVKTIDHCASDDGDGTNPISVADWDNQFSNQSYVSDVDYRLKAGSVLIDSGIGPSLDADVPTTDIIGDTRSGTVSSVGPFENGPTIPTRVTVVVIG